MTKDKLPVFKLTVTGLDERNVVLSLRVRGEEKWYLFDNVRLGTGDTLSVLDGCEDDSIDHAGATLRTLPRPAFDEVIREDEDGKG